MVVLLDLCFRARTIAASMVIEGPEATDDAPLGPKQSGGRRGSDFLVSRGMTLAERQGKKVAHSPLRHRRSRLQPAFGQITQKKRPFGALDPNRDGVKENVATLVLPPRPPRQMSVAMKPLPARPAFFGFRDRFDNAPKIRLDVVCAAKDR